MDDKNQKIVFHIVNSIKGGSGKSTVSFFLADHFNRESDSKAVIIDLDVNGSSWFNDHKIENYENNFIQNYFYKPEGILSRESARIVYRYQDKDDNNANTDGRIEAYLCDPKKSFHLSEYELDLFENLISVIIDSIIVQNGNKENIHIILDMPPSYEEHAARIVNHLIIDVNSPLYKKHKDKYEIIHHLICDSAYSHIKLNINYLINYLLGESYRSYSNAIKELLKNNQYGFVFTVNNSRQKIQKKDYSDTELSEVKDRIYKAELSSIKKEYISIAFINSYDFLYATWNECLENKATSIPACRDNNDNCFKVVENMDDAMNDFYKTVDGRLKVMMVI